MKKKWQRIWNINKPRAIVYRGYADECIKSTKCEKLKSLNEFHKRKTNKCGYRNPCIECYKKYIEKNVEKIRKTKRKYYLKHQDEICKSQKEYYENNKDRMLNKLKKYREENREQIRERDRKYNQKQRDNLTDVYIKNMLTGGNNLKPEDIPQELIEAKRQHLKLKRITKET